MEFRHLQALVAVVDLGSFSSAAEFLGTVQSNISAHVARLERELGVELIDRSSGQATEEGLAVVSRARRVMNEAAALVSDVAALKDEVTGSVRIGMIGTTARWLVPQLLTLARDRHPKMRLVVAEGTTATLQGQLEGGQLDLAILNLPVPNHDIAVQFLFEEDLMLVVPPDHPLATHARGSLALADIAELDLLLALPGTSFRNELDAAVRPSGIELRALAELDGLRLIASLTFEGYGPAILPASAMPSYLSDRFRLLPVEGLPRRKVGVAQRRRGHPSAPARALLDLLHQITEEENLPSGLHHPDADAVGLDH